MKNREEYQASIFAKRDALLKKRRKRISQAAAGAGVLLCFTAAFFVMPRILSHKSSKTEAPVAATTAAYLEEHMSQIQAEAEEHAFYSSYINSSKVHNDINDTAAENNTFKAVASVTKQQVEEETKKGFGGVFSPELFEGSESSAEVPDGIQTEETKFEQLYATMPSGYQPPTVKYSDDEVIPLAYELLSDEEKSIVEEDKTHVLNSRKEGKNFYTVCFYIPDKIIYITFDEENLEFIKREDKERVRQGEVMTTPAHAPEGTTAKPAMTAALPAYTPE